MKPTRVMMMDSFPRLKTHADPGMDRISARVPRRGIRVSPYEGVGRQLRRAAAREARPRTQRDDLAALRTGEHVAAIDLRAVPGVGPDLVLTVAGEWRNTGRRTECRSRAGGVQ